MLEWQLHHYELIVQQPTMELVKPQARNVARGIALSKNTKTTDL